MQATTRTAPILKPEDLKQEYVYGLDAESIRKEFLTHLEITLAELPRARGQRVGALPQPRAHRARPPHRALGPHPKRLLRARCQARLLHVARVPDGADPGQQPPEPRLPRRGGAGHARTRLHSSKTCARRSGTPASATVAWDGSPPVSSTRWPPWRCPPMDTVCATSMACSISALSTAIRWRPPMPGCAMVTRGRFPAHTTSSASSSTGTCTSTSTTRGASPPTGSTPRTCWRSRTTPPSPATRTAPSTRCACGRPGPPTSST